MKKTRIIQVDVFRAETEKIQEIREILRRGGVIVYPTDTFYGLGTSCFSISGINRIYDIKGRESAKPLSVVISDLGMLDRVAGPVPDRFRSLVADSWPGPLTVILEASEGLPREMLGGRGTVGVRLPDFAWLRALIRAAGFPLTATSANLSGQAEFSSAEDAIDVFDGKVDVIVDAGRTAGGLPSTVVDLTGERPAILRQGAFPREKLRNWID